MLVSISAMAFDKKPPKGEMPWGPYLDGFATEDLSILDLADRICRGHGHGSVFDGRPHGDNFVMAQTIVLDFDGGDERSSMDWLKAQPFIRAYACLIYPTLSHTPDAPRHRVVFSLDMPIKGRAGYEMAAGCVIALYPHSDQSVGNAARTFFGNGRILTEGLDTYYDEKVLPLSHLRVMARQMLQRQRIEQARAEKQVRKEWKLGPRASGDIPSLLDVMRRLNAINPYSMGYDEWLRIGAGLAHTYGDDAFIPFKTWSDQPGHEPLSYGKWKSLAAPVPSPATIGSVLHLLKERGA